MSKSWCFVFYFYFYFFTFVLPVYMVLLRLLVENHHGPHDLTVCTSL